MTDVTGTRVAGIGYTVSLGWGRHTHLILDGAALAVCGCPAAFDVPHMSAGDVTCAWCRGWLLDDPTVYVSAYDRDKLGIG